MAFGIIIFLVIELILIQGNSIKHGYCKEAVNSINYVTSCPTSKEEWDIAATKKNCTEIAKQQNCTPVDKFLYHCLSNEYNNALLEVCAPQRRIIGHCVEFNVGGGFIQDTLTAPCSTTFPKCDLVHYMSSDAYLYPDCYERVIRRKTTLSTTHSTIDMTTSKSEAGIRTEFIGVGIFVIVIVIVFSVFIMMAFYIKKRRNMINKTSKSRKEERKLIADKPQGMKCPMSTFGSRGKELFRRSISV